MMKKGVAVPYVIAILLGIAVIGFVGYSLFSTGGNLGRTATTQECTTAKLTYCQDWSRTNFGLKPLTQWNTNCDKLGVTQPGSESDCRSILGTLKESGQSCTADNECRSGSCPDNLQCPTGTLNRTSGKCSDGSTPTNNKVCR